MTLNLDLSASDAKLDRAEEHMKSLKAEVSVATEQRHPHSIMGEVDPQTGWCSVILRRNKPAEPRLAAIVGDYIHNLRSALNYIITALVDATPGLALGTAHQFPIYDDPATYATKVWRVGERVGRGCLAGIVHGLAIIEPLQPYHTEPDPDADPLATCTVSRTPTITERYWGTGLTHNRARSKSERMDTSSRQSSETTSSSG